jgi:hypothetical protein
MLLSNHTSYQIRGGYKPSFCKWNFCPSLVSPEKLNFGFLLMYTFIDSFLKFQFKRIIELAQFFRIVSTASSD